ncbi:MAG TPA: hypothetical protein VK177_07765 [Flavobacteriales bacterium]|nr:hypothetical protein [Flavobacteriales bacterium]
MKTKFILVIGFFISFSSAIAQYDEVFNYLKPMDSFQGEKNLPADEKRKLLFKALQDVGWDSDTMPMGENIAYYEEMLTSGDSMYLGMTPLDSLIHVVDLNGDNKQDIVFHVFNWGFGLYTGVFMNQGKKFTNFDFPATLFTGTTWDKNKLTGAMMMEIGCYMCFKQLKVCSVKEEKVNVIRNYNIYPYAWDRLELGKKGTYIKCNSKKISLLKHDVGPNANNFRGEEADEATNKTRNKITMKEDGYYLVETYENYKFIIFRGTSENDDKTCDENYYCGWTKDL